MSCGLRLIERPSPNHGVRAPGTGVRLIVFHYTGMLDASSALRRLCDPATRVSAHYTIDEDGTVYQHVAEERRAWHAGVGWWYGETDINSWSIGIELVNPGHEWGYRPFPTPQIEAAIALGCDLRNRYQLEAHAVVGHSDIAPARKTDPGEYFAWTQLAAAGLGLWPFPDAQAAGKPETGGGANGTGELPTGGLPSEDRTAQHGGAKTNTKAQDRRILDSEEASVIPVLLALSGYQTTNIAIPQVLTAFQRRYHPQAIHDGHAGEPDEETVSRLTQLARVSSSPFF